MNEISISYIIPVYNGESFIADNVKRLLSSIDEQDEVIVIDDCSTDQTVEILKQIDDSRFVLETLSYNQGVAGARNKGIELVRKEYLTFVDADDFLTSEYFVEIKHKLDDYERPNILRYRTFDSKSEYQQTGLIEINDDILSDIYSTSNLLHSSCCQLISSRFINENKIRFTTDIHFGEDMLFTFTLFSFVDEVVLINDNYYVYNTLDGSLSNTLDYTKIMTRIENINVVYQKLIAMTSSNSLKEVFSKKFKREVSNQALKLFMTDRKKFKNDRKQLLTLFEFDALMNSPIETVYDRFYDKMIHEKALAISFLGNSYAIIKKIKG